MMAFRSALIAQQGLRVLSGMQIALARRLLTSTSLDDFNKELTDFFGTAPGEQTPAATNDVPKAGTEPAERAAQTDVAMFNSELFGLLGTSQRDAAVAATSLAQHLVELTAQQGDAPPLQRNSGASSVPGSSGSASTAAASDFSAGDSGSSYVPPQHGLTHVDAGGRAAMVDVSDKAATVRTATAGARVLLGPEVFDLVSKNQLKKGDVLTVAQLAGVMGAKHTSALIPLCHNILLSKVHVSLALDPGAAAVDITASATTVGPTGVEMEALTAAAVAALCVYDMCKAASKGIVVTDLRLLAKSGGRSGDWRRSSDWRLGEPSIGG